MCCSDEAVERRAEISAIPTTRRAYCWDPATKRCALQTIPIPTLNNDQLLIKVEATGIMPLDLLSVQGNPLLGFGVGPGPHVVGISGVGRVVDHGKNAYEFKDRRVAVGPLTRVHGMWSDYAVVPTTDVMVVDEKLPAQDGLMYVAGAFTADMLLSLAKKNNARCVAISAANAPFARIAARVLQTNGIDVIHLVRKNNKEKDLRNEGAKFVVNTSQIGWEKTFQELALQNRVNLVFDLVGGELFTKLVSLSPEGTTVCSWGSLAAPPSLTLNQMDMFSGKSVMGALMMPYVGALKPYERKEKEDYFRSHPQLYKYGIIGTYPLERIDEALQKEFANKQAPESLDGRIILIPQ